MGGVVFGELSSYQPSGINTAFSIPERYSTSLPGREITQIVFPSTHASSAFIPPFSSVNGVFPVLSGPVGDE
jgi:hypothetical protein